MVVRLGTERVALIPAACRLVDIQRASLPIGQLSDIGSAVPWGPVLGGLQGVVAPNNHGDRVIWAIDEMLSYEDGVLELLEEAKPFSYQITLKDGERVPVLDLTRVRLSGGDG
jgi:hypothetical protein